MRYVYGMVERRYGKGRQPMEGFCEVIEDLSETFWDILVYDRRLSRVEEREYGLCYLGVVRL